MGKLEKNGKGIVLMHDIHKTTAKSVPLLLVALKEKGYKIVHMRAKGELKTLAEYDQMIEKDAKGLPVAGAEKPVSAIVKTVAGDTPESEKSQSEKAAAQTAAPEEPVKAEAEPPASSAPAAAGDTSAPGTPSEATMETTAASTPAQHANGAPETTASIGTMEEGAQADDAKAPPAKKPKGWMQRASDVWKALVGE